jgi:hypothetical protein
MKTYFFFAVMILGFFGVIAAIAKPELIEQKYNELTRPITEYQNEAERQKWKTAKEQEHARWTLEHQLPSDCMKSEKAMRQLECANMRDINEGNFARVWQKKIRDGWKP